MFSVNARPVYARLRPHSAASAFSHWIKSRIRIGQLKENVDYISRRNGHCIEYYLTIPAAGYIETIEDVVNPTPYVHGAKTHVDQDMGTSDLHLYTGHRSNSALMERLMAHTDRLGIEFTVRSYVGGNGKVFDEMFLTEAAINCLIDNHIIQLYRKPTSVRKTPIFVPFPTVSPADDPAAGNVKSEPAPGKLVVEYTFSKRLLAGLAALAAALVGLFAWSAS